MSNHSTTKDPKWSPHKGTKMYSKSAPPNGVLLGASRCPESFVSLMFWHENCPDRAPQSVPKRGQKLTPKGDQKGDKNQAKLMRKPERRPPGRRPSRASSRVS